MRAIDHLAADRQHTGAGLCFERGDNGGGVLNLRRRRREGGVDYGNLGRVNGELAGEALTGGCFGLSTEAIMATEVSKHAVDRLDPGRDGSGKAQRAGHLVSEGERTVLVIFG